MKRLFGTIAGYIKNTDKFMWLYCIILSCTSVLLLYSIYYNGFVESYKIVVIQAVAGVMGITVAIIISKMDYRVLAALWKIHAPIALILVLITFTPLGVQHGGADDKAWLDLGIISLQPSEILKLSFVFTFAFHLSKVKEHINDIKTFLLLCAHGAIPSMLIVLQGDFGSALVFVCIFIMMMFYAGVSWKYIATGVLSAAVATPLVYFFLFQELHRERVRILFNPERDPTGMGFQQMQGRIALGSGQLYGRGLFGRNLINSIPEVYNDFIFSYIGQTMGFVGCVAVALVMMLLCIKILMTARASKDAMGSYICVGICAIFLFQSVVNIGMVLSVLPVIGITLPFLSYGGTSVFTMYVSAGIVLSVYMNNVRRTMFD
ncbi:MAG: Bacterial cell division rane protein [Oscillospiraceae bacterium]|jgi:rod shape determining protein RodA|nr:Bacterial cell division rane protein [Oscillospiraceae bacterium]